MILYTCDSPLDDLGHGSQQEVFWALGRILTPYDCIYITRIAPRHVCYTSSTRVRRRRSAIIQRLGYMSSINDHKQPFRLLYRVSLIQTKYCFSYIPNHANFFVQGVVTGAGLSLYGVANGFLTRRPLPYHIALPGLRPHHVANTLERCIEDFFVEFGWYPDAL